MASSVLRAASKITSSASCFALKLGLSFSFWKASYGLVTATSQLRQTSTHIWITTRSCLRLTQCSMVWALLRTEKEKPAAGKTDYWRDFWRRRWDSNPRTLADQLISSQSRYDHFDTSPYLSQHQRLRKRGELMGRTSKNIKLRIPGKPRKIKGFRSGRYRVATTISSRSRYDHFDTAPEPKNSIPWAAKDCKGGFNGKKRRLCRTTIHLGQTQKRKER